MIYQEGKKPKKKKALSLAMLIVAVILLVSGVYLLLLTQSPALTFLDREVSSEAVDKIEDNKVLVPSANIDVEIYQGDESALDKGAWHRFPERGNPVEGGNFIISAHRFGLGATPQATRANSAFYNIEELTEGDEIVIHWEGKRYDYEVSKKYQVEPTATEVEDPREDHVLTMYSCTLGGRYDGRIIIEAEPKFEVESEA